MTELSSDTLPKVRHGTAWGDLRDWLALLEQHGQLHTVREEVDPNEELSAITFMATRKVGAPALLFEQTTGNRSGARVLTNMLASSKERYALAVGLDPALPVREMIRETRAIMKRRIPPVHVPKSEAPVNEVLLTGDQIDMTRYPVPKFWPGDGGAFIGTGNVTITRNPDTGVLNVGVYRQMLHGPKRVGVNMVPGRHGALNCEAWWARGKPCEVVVAYGIDPAVFIAATQVFGHDESELDVAGGLKGKPVTLTEAEIVDLPILAEAELVVEGLVHPNDEEMEGPLGEFHGYYSGRATMKPVIEIKAVHQRPAPIMTAALMATYPSGEIGEYHAIMRSARIWDNLEAMGVPGVRGVYAYPAAASAAGLLVVSLKQMYAGHTAQVLALAAQCPAAAYCIRWIVAVDEDVDPTDINQVMWALSTRSNPADDIDILRNTWSYRSDPSLAPEMRPYGSKALIDACKPHRHMKTHPKRSFLRREVAERVASRWAELGLPGTPPVLDQFHE